MTGFELALSCLALNIYHEAAFEPPTGQYAVAFVTINRAAKHNGDICKEVFKPRQFSWANDALDKNGKLLPKFLPTNNPRWKQSRAVAKIALTGDIVDFTGGATHYHADYIKQPTWAKKLTFVGKHGVHLFYR